SADYEIRKRMIAVDRKRRWAGPQDADGAADRKAPGRQLNRRWFRQGENNRVTVLGSSQLGPERAGAAVGGAGDGQHAGQTAALQQLDVRPEPRAPKRVDEVRRRRMCANHGHAPWAACGRCGDGMKLLPGLDHVQCPRANEKSWPQGKEQSLSQCSFSARS